MKKLPEKNRFSSDRIQENNTVPFRQKTENLHRRIYTFHTIGTTITRNNCKRHRIYDERQNANIPNEIVAVMRRVKTATFLSPKINICFSLPRFCRKLTARMKKKGAEKKGFSTFNLLFEIATVLPLGGNEWGKKW